MKTDELKRLVIVLTFPIWILPGIALFLVAAIAMVSCDIWKWIVRYIKTGEQNTF